MHRISLLLGVCIFALDLLSKWWVENSVWLRFQPKSIIPGFFTLHYVRNEGIAFGLFHDNQSEWKVIVLTAIAVLAVGIVIFYIFHTPKTEILVLSALGMLLGGILGNFVDRLMHGYVVDFLTLHWKTAFSWPTFNIADTAISCGVAIILFKTLTSNYQLAAVIALFLLPMANSDLMAQPEVTSIIGRLQQKYEGIGSFSAQFEQTFESRGIELQESGRVMMKKPGKMYWEYTHPTKKYFVADGKKTYFYVPKENQVIVSRLSLDEVDSPLLFLLGKGDIERDFDVEVIPPQGENAENGIRLRLTPKQPQPEFIELLLDIRLPEYVINRLTVIEPIGQQNAYDLSDFRENVQIPNEMFKLDLPSKVEVIEQ